MVAVPVHTMYLALAAATGSAGARAAAAPLPDSIVHGIDSAISVFMAARKVPGLAVAIGLGQQLVWTQGHGFASVKSLLPVTAAPLFQTGSVGKSTVFMGRELRPRWRCHPIGGLLCVPPVAVSTTLPKPVDLDERLTARITGYLTDIASFGYSGAVIVIKDGRTLVHAGYGRAGTNPRLTPASLVDVGSLTKQFTAAAILQLERADRLRGTDSLAGLLPGIPADKAGITVDQLLTHRSGIRAAYGDRARFGYAETFRRILARPLQFPPGTDQQYSNAGYVLLAAIVERVSGEPFRDYVRRVLFEPAGMARSGFRGRYPAGLSADDVAPGNDELGVLADPHRWSDTVWADLGAAGVVTSADDLRVWFSALADGRIFPGEWQRRFLSPQSPQTGGLGGYGYGLMVTQSPDGEAVVRHSGDPTGYGAGFIWYPTRNTLVISTSDIRHDLYPTHVLADEVIPRILSGQSYDAPPHGTPLTAAAARAVLGRYRLDDGATIEIEWGTTGLMALARGQSAIDAMSGAPPDSLRQRAETNDRTSKAVAGWFGGDTLPLSQALGPGGDAADFGRAMAEEMTTAALGKTIRRRMVLGSAPAGGPWGALNTIVALELEGGAATYKIKWNSGVIEESGPRAGQAPLQVPLVQLRPGILAGWNILTRKAFRLRLGARRGGVVSAVTIEGEGSPRTATRHADLAESADHSVPPGK